MKEKNSLCPPLSLSFPHGTGQSWEINRNKLHALHAEPSLQKAVEAGGEAKERQTVGEMKLDRRRAANKNPSDSWKQFI